jgi:hypothetical protein
VFSLQVEDTALKGRLSFVLLSLRELRDIPEIIIREHIRERRKGSMETQANDLQFDNPISRIALLVGVGLFLLALITEINVLFSPLLLGLLAFVVIVSVFGIIKGFPSWALPSIGLLLAGLILGVQAVFDSTWLKDQIVTVGGEFSRYIYTAVIDGIFWVSLLLLTIILFLILAALPRYRQLSRRLKHDWTLISFTLYGASVLVLIFSWDNYRYLEPYKISAFLFLAVGAWGYLRSNTSRKRLLSILAGVTLAMTTIAIGKWILVPQQEWPEWFQWNPPQSERWFESLGTLINLGWMLIVLAAPGLLGLFLIKKETTTAPPTLVP